MEIIEKYRQMYSGFSLPKFVFKEPRVREEPKIKEYNYFALDIKSGRPIYIDTNASTRWFITGTSGGGKTNTIHTILAKYYEDGHKFIVIDPKGEYYMMKYKGERSDYSLAMEDLRVLVPNFSKFVHREVPFAEKFKILFKELEPNDLSQLIGQTTQTAGKLNLSKVISEFKPRDLEELIYFVEAEVKGVTKNSILTRLYELQKLDVVSSDEGLSFEEIIKCDEPIVFDFRECGLADDMRTLFMQGFVAVLIRKEFDMKYAGKIKRKRILNVFDEVSTLLQKHTTSYTYIGQLLRLGRSFRLDCILSTQYPKDVPPPFYQNCNRFVFHRIPSPDAVEHIRKALGSYGSFVTEDIQYLPTGEAIYVDMDTSEVMHVKVAPSPVGKHQGI